MKGFVIGGLFLIVSSFLPGAQAEGAFTQGMLCMAGIALIVGRWIYMENEVEKKGQPYIKDSFYDNVDSTKDAVKKLDD